MSEPQVERYADAGQERYVDSPDNGSDAEKPLLEGEVEREDEYTHSASAGQRYQVLRIAGFALMLVVLAGLVLSQLFAPSPAEPHGEIEPSKESAEKHPLDQYVISPLWNFNAPAQRREYFWTVEDKELNPDGVYRPMMVINGQFPGPMIEVNEGDTIVVHVENKAANATSFHWHGMYQNGTNWMDGTVGVTQCPIASGSKFTYEFTVGNQYGTYWYHAHQGVQAADGLVGPLVVHSKEEKALEELDYASDRVIMVQDHYHDPSSLLLMSYLASDNENAEPVPDGGLINGKGIRDCKRFPHRRCDTSNASLAHFELEANKPHKLRFINVGVFAEFQITIDEHTMALTEVDGTVTRPAYFERLNINPAQRYSVVVNANSTAGNSFWLRGKMLAKCFTDPPKFIETDVSAVVAYSNAETDVEPQSKDWTFGPDVICRDLNLTNVTPLPEIAAPAADETFYLRANFEIGAYRLARGKFNQSSFKPQVKSPSLHRSIDGLTTGNNSFTSNSLLFVNDKGFDDVDELVIQTSGVRVIDLIISGFDEDNHPLHLHGYKYFILAQGHGYPPADLLENVDLSNPMRRDTASVEAFGWIALRFVADNPGMWAFHCHNTWHAEAGLFMQFLTRSDELAKQKIPKANLQLCDAPVSELEKGTRPKDEVFMIS